jgi:hypothetical protein
MAEKAAAVDTRIDSVLQEQRKFPPPADFAERAHIKSLEEYERIYKESVEEPEKFWGRVARELYWFKPWDRVLECPVGEVVCRGADQPFVQLPRPTRPNLAQEQSRAGVGE